MQDIYYVTHRLRTAVLGAQNPMLRGSESFLGLDLAGDFSPADVIKEARES